MIKSYVSIKTDRLKCGELLRDDSVTVWWLFKFQSIELFGIKGGGVDFLNTTSLCDGQFSLFDRSNLKKDKLIIEKAFKGSFTYSDA